MSLLSGASALILGAAVGYYYTSQKSSDEKPQDKPVIGQVSEVKNDVKRKYDSSFAWNYLGKEQPVYYKDAIFIGNNSSMKIRLGESELSIGENSLIVLDQKVSTEKGQQVPVLEVGVVRGQVAVTQATGSAQKTASGKPPKKIQLALNDKVKIQLDKNSNIAVTKADNKASVLVKSGEVKLSQQDKSGDATRDPASSTLHDGHETPTFIQDINLDSEKDVLSNAKVESVKIPEVSTATSSASGQVVSAPSMDESDQMLKVLAQQQPVSQQVISQGSLEGLPLAHKDEFNQASNTTKEEFKQELKAPEVAEAPKEVPKEPEAEEKPKDEIPPPMVAQPTPTPVKEKSKKGRIVLLAPEDKKQMDYSLSMAPINFTWDVHGIKPESYYLEVSAQESFRDVLAQVKVDEARSLSLEPGGFPGVVKQIFKHQKVYWRVMPLGSHDKPLLPAAALPKRMLHFSVSNLADISIDSNLYYEKVLFEQTEYPPFNIEWKLRRVLPGKFDLQLSTSPDFKNVFCHKEVVKYNDPDRKTPFDRTVAMEEAISEDLVFEERVSIDPHKECGLIGHMLEGQTIYYQVASTDLGGNPIVYQSPQQSVGNISIREFSSIIGAYMGLFSLSYTASSGDTLDTGLQPSIGLIASIFFRRALEFYSELEYALLGYIFERTTNGVTDSTSERKSFIRTKLGAGYQYQAYKEGDRKFSVGARTGLEYRYHSLGDNNDIIENNTTYIGIFGGVPLEFQVTEDVTLKSQYKFVYNFNNSSMGHEAEGGAHYRLTDRWSAFAAGKWGKININNATGASTYLNITGYGGVTYGL